MHGHDNGGTWSGAQSQTGHSGAGDDFWKILALVIHEEDPVIVLGDLNATPWSPVFKKLLGETRLVDARRGFGLRPTWPSTFPPLWIPIDHCLVSPGIEIRDFRVGPACGSDHHALVVDMALPLAPENDAP